MGRGAGSDPELYRNKFTFVYLCSGADGSHGMLVSHGVHKENDARHLVRTCSEVLLVAAAAWSSPGGLCIWVLSDTRGLFTHMSKALLQTFVPRVLLLLQAVESLVCLGATSLEDKDGGSLPNALQGFLLIAAVAFLRNFTLPETVRLVC